VTMVLEARYLQMVREFLAQFVPGVEVWGFGSRVTGSAKPYSDLDLALVSETPVNLAKRASLSLALQESDLPFRVDLVELRELTPSIRAEIRSAHEVIQPIPARTQ
jgi:uncharacterized protein